jgi:hypothetical protein
MSQTFQFSFEWIAVGRGRLALTHRPRQRWFPYLSGAGCDRLATLLSEREGAMEIGRLAQSHGLAWTWIPLDSGRPPQGRQNDAVRKGLVELDAALTAGESVLHHCSAGIHRTGMVAYALLRTCGAGRDAALELISRMRPATHQGLVPQHLDWGDWLTDE